MYKAALAQFAQMCDIDIHNAHVMFTNEMRSICMGIKCPFPERVYRESKIWGIFVFIMKKIIILLVV